MAPIAEPTALRTLAPAMRRTGQWGWKSLLSTRRASTTELERSFPFEVL
jgi:hypothetical protein